MAICSLYFRTWRGHQRKNLFFFFSCFLILPISPVGSSLCFCFNYFPHQAEADSKKHQLLSRIFSELHTFTFKYLLDFCPWLSYQKTELFIFCPPPLFHQHGLHQYIPGNILEFSRLYFLPINTVSKSCHFPHPKSLRFFICPCTD